jgi:hypothetical protein
MDNRPIGLTPQQEVRDATQMPVQPVFKDPTMLTNALRLFLALVVIGSAIGIYFTYLEYDFIGKAKAGFYESDEVCQAEGKASDTRQGTLGLVMVPVWLTTGILLLVWIYRASHNAHCITTVPMEYTPGWAVGWYFIPIFHAWKPYRVMKEIWQVSEGSVGDQAASRDGFVLVWWIVSLVSFALDRIAIKLSMKAQTLDELGTAAMFDLASTFFDIMYVVALLTLTSAIYSMQMARRPADPYHVR